MLQHFERNKRIGLIWEKVLEDLSADLGRQLGNRSRAGGLEPFDCDRCTGGSHSPTLLADAMGQNLVGEVGRELVDDAVLQFVRKVGEDGSAIGTSIVGGGVRGNHLSK